MCVQIYVGACKTICVPLQVLAYRSFADLEVLAEYLAQCNLYGGMPTLPGKVRWGQARGPVIYTIKVYYHIRADTARKGEFSGEGSNAWVIK